MGSSLNVKSEFGKGSVFGFLSRHYSIPDDEAERVEQMKKAALDYDHELLPEILK